MRLRAPRAVCTLLAPMLFEADILLPLGLCVEVASTFVLSLRGVDSRSFGLKSRSPSFVTVLRLTGEPESWLKTIQRF